MSLMSESTVPPILLVRFLARRPNGEAVGESRRVCHLVPLLGTGAEVAVTLRAYCGAEIAPGTAELLNGISGMPCETCLARSPIPAFALLRVLPVGMGDGESQQRWDQHRDGWSDRALSPEQRLAARFVLLAMLQEPTGAMTVGEIAGRLRQDPRTVHLILLLHAAVGWVQRAPDTAPSAWEDSAYRLTERGAELARRRLVRDLTATFTSLADGLGLDTTAIGGPHDAPTERAER